MDWKSKINTMIFCCLICLIAASAYTATFDNKEDALLALGQTKTVAIGDCKIGSVSEILETGKLDKSTITANIVLFYTVDGVETVSGKTINLPSIAEKTILDNAAISCEELKSEVMLQYAETLDVAIVNYMQGSLSSLKDKVYNFGKRGWD